MLPIMITNTRMEAKANIFIVDSSQARENHSLRYAARNVVNLKAHHTPAIIANMLAIWFTNPLNNPQNA
jgi:hypothetical protein